MVASLLLRNAAKGDDKNLCFTNAAIQILRNVPSFKEQCTEHKEFGIHGDLLKILEFVGTNRSISAHFLRKKIGEKYGREDLYDGQQSDAIEFCTYLLQNLHYSLSSLFRFKTKTKIDFWINNKPSNCQHCKRSPNDLDDEQLVLKLSFPKNFHLYNTSGIGLQQLINLHFELKEQEEPLKCSNCCTHNDGDEHDYKCKPKPFVTKDYITKYPKLLIVQLSRFFRDKVTGNINKIPTTVTNAQSISINDNDYELISILNHEGGYNSGHYTALLKGDNWYLCDDIRNSMVADNMVESEKNYAYIFKKKEHVFESEQPAEFVLTDEWQDIPPGVRIPGKFDVRINLTTGRQQARKLNVEQDNSDETGTRRNDSNINDKNQTNQSPINSSKNVVNNLSEINIDGNVPIPVEVLDAASDILCNQLQEGVFGLIPPSFILECLDTNTPIPVSMIIPKGESGLNVHLLRNKENIHYVVSCKIVSKSKTYFCVYDSLPPGKKMWVQRLKDLPKQLDMIYEDVPSLDNIEVICAQSQGYSRTTNNSGLFALANLIMLCNDHDPKKFKLHKDMRKQLKDMLSKDPFVLKPFAVLELSPELEKCN